MALSLAALLAAPAIVRAAAPIDLTEAVSRWAGEQDRWAFTQQVKEFDGDKIEQERYESYDPSRPESKRWDLISIDGRAPTADERASWDKRKNKKRKRDQKPLIDYFDFDRAQRLSDNGARARYSLPLQSGANWLFSTDKVQLTVTINREARSVERVDARISEPFKVALGLARVLDFDLIINMKPLEGRDAADPGATAPDGTVHAVVNKFGQRVEYRWNDFRRVTPHPDNVIAYAK